jgi:hypothetical protein
MAWMKLPTAAGMQYQVRVQPGCPDPVKPQKEQCPSRMVAGIEVFRAAWELSGHIPG